MIMALASVSSVKGVCSLRIVLSAVFTLLTARSHTPPMQGAAGGINFQTIFSFAAKSLITAPYNYFNFLLAPINAVPLSDKI